MLIPNVCHFTSFRFFKVRDVIYLRQRIVDKFTKLSKTGFSMDYCSADFSQFSRANVKICPLICRKGSYHQLLAFWGYS